MQICLAFWVSSCKLKASESKLKNSVLMTSHHVPLLFSTLNTTVGVTYFSWVTSHLKKTHFNFLYSSVFYNITHSEDLSGLCFAGQREVGCSLFSPFMLYLYKQNVMNWAGQALWIDAIQSTSLQVQEIQIQIPPKKVKKKLRISVLFPPLTETRVVCSNLQCQSAL